MRPSMTGFFHSAWCFQGSCGSLDQNSIPFHGRINQYFFNECFIHFSWFLLLVLEYITVTHLKNTCGFEYLYYIFLFVFLLVNSTVLMGIKQYRSIQSKIQIIPSTQTTTLHSSVFLCPYIFLYISPNIQTSLTSCLTLRSVKKSFILTNCLGKHTCAYLLEFLTGIFSRIYSRKWNYLDKVCVQLNLVEETRVLPSLYSHQWYMWGPTSSGLYQQLIVNNLWSFCCQYDGRGEETKPYLA